MIQYFKYRMELRHLGKVQQGLDREWKEAYQAAEIPGHDDDGELSSIGQESEELKNWIQYRQTKYLESICQSLVIPLLEKNDYTLYFKFDFDDGEGDRFILTTTGINQIRKMIREEKKARRENFGFWFTTIMGILGALIGLVSVLKK